MKHLLRILLLTGLTFLTVQTVHAQEAQRLQTLPAETLSYAPVLHNGRIKPLDSLARITLKTIHGKDHLPDLSAAQWIHTLITDPAAAAQRPDLFAIKNAQLKKRLGLPQEQKYISATALINTFQTYEDQIETLITKPQNQLSQNERDILHLYDTVLGFGTLLEGKSIIIQTKIDKGTRTRLALEVLYNKTKPHTFAIGLYILALLLTLIAHQTQKISWNIAAFTSILLGGSAHAAMITMRVIILERPPVGTLYESVIFVSLICALIAIFAALKKPKPLILGIGALAASGLLLLAPITSQTHETMDPLVAVLNTNFWLTVHVLCITAGYALCIMSALSAHVGLAKPDKKFQNLTHKLSLWALLFTAIGTCLGGIWADQSWGRFWGWDPKENGALLIVLWLIWLHHARHGAHISNAAFLAGCAALNIIVALAWFGVNLLGVGLHSYGFTSGLAAGLFTFCAAQTIIITALWVIRTRKKTAP